MFFCEFKEEINPLTKKNLEIYLDGRLKSVNLAYDRARKNKKLDMVKLNVVSKDTFNNIKEHLLKKGVSKNQIKIPRVILNSNELFEILTNRIILIKLLEK